jgi:hypothetical protein
MSRAQTKYRPNVEQVESRQMLSAVPSAVPSGFTIPSKQGHIDRIGDGFVGMDSSVFTTTKPVYLSSLTNSTDKTLKIDGVYASFSGRSNFTTKSALIPGGRILFWTQDVNAKFLIDLTVDKTKISTTGQVPAGAEASPTQFRKTGTGKDEVGWERIDFPLAKSSSYTITAVRNTSDKITRIVINTPST